MGTEQTSLFVELGPKLSAAFRRACADKHMTPGDKLRQLIVGFLESETGTAYQKPRARLARTSRFIMLEAPEQFLVSDLARAHQTSPQNIRYALTQLAQLGFVQEAGFTKVAGKGAMTYERTDIGKIWALEERQADAAIAPGKSDLSALRAAATLFLVDEGFSLDVAKKCIEDEEMICHMSEVKMDYSLAFWRQWLKERREAHPPDVVNGAL